MKRYVQITNKNAPFKEPGKCIMCGKPVAKGRRLYCSEACCIDREVISGWRVRGHVLNRDHGICARCGLDVCELQREVRRMLTVHKCSAFRSCYEENTFRKFCSDNRITINQSMWEAHHKVAVIHGGGACGIDNYETLCIWCHKKETKALRHKK